MCSALKGGPPLLTVFAGAARHTAGRAAAANGAALSAGVNAPECCLDVQLLHTATTAQGHQQQGGPHHDGGGLSVCRTLWYDNNVTGAGFARAEEAGPPPKRYASSCSSVATPMLAPARCGSYSHACGSYSHACGSYSHACGSYSHACGTAGRTAHRNPSACADTDHTTGAVSSSGNSCGRKTNGSSHWRDFLPFGVRAIVGPAAPIAPSNVYEQAPYMHTPLGSGLGSGRAAQLQRWRAFAGIPSQGWDPPSSSAGAAGAAAEAARTAAAPSAAAAPPAAADPVYNLPNAISMARLVSGPVIGYWMLQGQLQLATAALVVSGASDWLDGFVARRLRQSSVFGSFLDPLADKVLVGCVAAALLYQGVMPAWLGVLVVGRDVALVGGAMTARLAGFGWRWPGAAAFFRTADVSAAAAAAPSPPAAEGAEPMASAAAAPPPPAGVKFMQPLLISKANTVLQLALVGGYLVQGLLAGDGGAGSVGAPSSPEELQLAVRALEVATATTTVVSGLSYGWMYRQGKLVF